MSEPRKINIYSETHRNPGDKIRIGKLGSDEKVDGTVIRSLEDKSRPIDIAGHDKPYFYGQDYYEVEIPDDF